MSIWQLLSISIYYIDVFLSGWIYTLTRFAFLLCKQICSRYTSAAGERIYMMQSNKKVAFSHFFRQHKLILRMI